MPKNKPAALIFRGHMVPVRLEALGEEDYEAILSFGHYNLLFLGRQVSVFDGEGCLDILAMDKCGHLWVFEFKRDVARPDSVSQLLTYAAYAAGLNRAKLDEIFREKGNRKANASNLGDAFQKHFGQEMPELPHKICLVLVAFDFTRTCERTLDFLNHACGLQIGRLKMRWVVNPGEVERREFRYISPPFPTNQMLPGHTADYAIAFYEFDANRVNWDLYRKSSLLILPPLENPEDPDVPNQGPRSLKYEELKRGMGLFVYMRVSGVKADPNDSLEIGHPVEGLVGYGIIQDHAHEIREEDLVGLKSELGYEDDDEHPFEETPYKSAPWVVQVDWEISIPMHNAISTPLDFSKLHNHLAPLKSNADIKTCFESLGLEFHAEYFNEVPF